MTDGTNQSVSVNLLGCLPTVIGIAVVIFLWYHGAELAAKILGTC